MTYSQSVIDLFQNKRELSRLGKIQDIDEQAYILCSDLGKLM